MITQDIINNNIIHIYYDNEYKVANLKLDENKRYIKSFTDIGLDITIIEILEEDNISKDNFLCFELETMKNRLINNKIYIFQYVKGKELKNVKGEIKEINKYEFTHSASIEFGSQGSPIFLENSINVIGIHKDSNKDKRENYGYFILFIL